MGYEGGINPKDPWGREERNRQAREAERLEVRDDTVLDEASRIVTGVRADQYGPPDDHWVLVARLWSAYLGTEVSALDACVLMVLLKQARLRHGYHRDSVVDTAGYALVQELVSQR